MKPANVSLMLLITFVMSLACFAKDNKIPDVKMRTSKAATAIYWGKEPIVCLKDNQFLRFRATSENDHWIGTQTSGADITWEYGSVIPYKHEKAKFEKTDDGFILTMIGRKPAVDGLITTTIQGIWDPQSQSFAYILGSTLKCSLDKWYDNSNRAAAVFKHSPKKPATVEAIDYHINRISLPDRNYNDPASKELYNGFVFSKDMEEWQLYPKIHLPGVFRKGNYKAELSKFTYAVGTYFGFLDENEGGWMTQLLESPAPMKLGACWMFWDIHVYMPDAVPPRSDKEWTCSYKIKFWQVSPARSREILAKAAPVKWQGDREYQLPLFSHDNKFDKLISGNSELMWWANNYNCFRDDKVGFDDHYSVSIKQDSGYSVWYAGCWGKPWDTHESTGGRLYKITAKVKTENCTGTVRLAGVIPDQPEFWFKNSISPDRPAQWTFSNTLTGTNDWKELSIQIRRKESMYMGKHFDPAMIVLEQIGAGQSWFDNVKIERIE